jgi:hypothetical protein
MKLAKGMPGSTAGIELQQQDERKARPVAVEQGFRAAPGIPAPSPLPGSALSHPRRCSRSREIPAARAPGLANRGGVGHVHFEHVVQRWRSSLLGWCWAHQFCGGRQHGRVHILPEACCTRRLVSHKMALRIVQLVLDCLDLGASNIHRVAAPILQQDLLDVHVLAGLSAGRVVGVSQRIFLPHLRPG